MLGPENYFGTLQISTRGLPYQYTVNQALQIMQIHANGLMKSWPPHSGMWKKFNDLTFFYFPNYS